MKPFLSVNIIIKPRIKVNNINCKVVKVTDHIHEMTKYIKVKGNVSWAKKKKLFKKMAKFTLIFNIGFKTSLLKNDYHIF